LLGQSWNSDLAGGTALRSGIQACIVAACRKQQAAFLLSTEEAKLAETLRPQSGEVLLKVHWAEPIERIRMPWGSASHLETISDRVRRAPARPLTSLPEARPVVTASVRPSATARASISPAELLAVPPPDGRTDGRTADETADGDKRRIYLKAMA